MKNLSIGCLGAILGVVVGIAISFLGSAVLAKPQTQIAPPSSAHPDLSITASATFVSSQVEQSLRQSNLAKSATVTFAPPNLIRIAANTQTNALGFSISVNVTLALSISTQNGRIALKTESVDTGGLPVPQAALDAAVERLRAQAEDQINRAVQSALRGSNLRVSSIRVTANDLTVELNGQ